MSKCIIECLNNGKSRKYPEGTTLSEILKDQNLKNTYPIIGAYVNNRLKELSYRVFGPKKITFIDLTNSDGMRMYERSLSFVLYKAVVDLYPEAVLKIHHSISKGFYCEIENLPNQGAITYEIVEKIKKRMNEIIAEDIPFKREHLDTEKAIEIFNKHGLTEKTKLLHTRKTLYTSVYTLDDKADYFFGYLAPSTGYLQKFDLVKYFDGILLRKPDRNNPEQIADCVVQNKMFDIFKEHKNWAKVLKFENIGSLNECVDNNNINEFIKISEALHEKKVVQIADMIHNRKDKVRFIFISGPSSSGKTSFCKRLDIQLKVAGFKTLSISLDNYFVSREETPLDENGDYDFEALEAIDINLFNSNLKSLIKGEEVDLPTFDFPTGQKIYGKKVKKIDDDYVILIEGIHALNPKLTPSIANELKFRIYVSALTQIAIDNHNRIPTTDNRLLRRMVRDYKYRSYSALNTLKRWASVRRGEEKNIFPHQEQADVMFNSALIYELGVLKKQAEPLLREIRESDEKYAEAKRLLKFLSYFHPVPDKEIPPTSILREFLGGSSFKY